MLARHVARTGLLAALLLSLGCRPRPEPPAEPVAPVAAEAPPALPRALPPPPVAVATAPTQLMPEGTDLVVSAASVQHLLRVVDLPALIARYRPYYDQAAAYIEQTTGHNLLDPLKWPEIGVSPDGPLGGAFLDADAEAGCFFFTLSDPTRFREFVDRLGDRLGGRLHPVFEDRGVVLASEAGASMSLVLRDSFAFVVLVDNPGRAPFDYARELASVDPARGLSATPRWQKAVGAGPPRDLLAFVDIGEIVRDENEAMRRRAEHPEPTWTELELQRLREQGAPAEDIARWEKMAEEQRTAEAEMRERRRKSREFTTAVFEPLGPLVFEFSLSDTAVAGTMRAQAPETALVRRVIQARGAEPLAITTAGEKVLFGASASVDVKEALAALDALLRSEGSSLDRVLGEIHKEVGVDPRAALEGFDGTASFALTLGDPAALGTEGASKAMGFTLALGVKDPAVEQTMLDAAALKSPPRLKARRDPKTRGWTVSLPDWRKVHIAVVGRALTVSTDPDFSRRVARGATGPLDKILPAPVVPVVTTREAAGSLVMDYLLPIGFFMARSSSDYRYDPSSNQPYWRFQDVAHDKIDAVPQSPAYKAKLREWRSLDQKARRAEEARERKTMQMLLGVAQSLGAWAMNVRETADGLVAEGGQYFGPGGLTRTIEQAVDAASNRMSNDPAYDVYEQRSRVEQEMQEIRVRDVEKALGLRAAATQ